MGDVKPDVFHPSHPVHGGFYGPQRDYATRTVAPYLGEGGNANDVDKTQQISDSVPRRKG